MFSERESRATPPPMTLVQGEARRTKNRRAMASTAQEARLQGKAPCQARREDTKAAQRADTPGHAKQATRCTSGPGTGRNACASCRAGANRRQAARCRQTHHARAFAHAQAPLGMPLPPTGTQCRPGQRKTPNLTTSELKLLDQRTGPAEIQH